MKNYLLLSAVLFLITSCKIGQSSEGKFGQDSNKDYQLILNPGEGSNYDYSIVNESDVEMDVDGNKTNIYNKAEVRVKYNISKDTSGNFLLKMRYDKIHILSENGNTKTDMNTDNASITDDPLEKALGSLKEVELAAIVSPSGEVKAVTGYDELGDKVIRSFTLMDENTKAVAKLRWDKMIGESLIKKNLEQLFSIFPDSSIHVGDKWKMDSKEGSEIAFKIRTFFTLTEINNDIAFIKTEGKISSDSAFIELSGKQILADLTGKQEGEFQIEKATGMMLRSKTSSEVNGSVMVLGKEIPIVIKNTVTINGHRIKDGQ